jgi:CRISPR-associated protein Csm1
LLVGPWSEIPYLAQEIYTEFKEYTCKNPDITLSGGLFFCKEKFPVKRFAPLVGEELGRAKEAGRDKVAIFGETVRWKGNPHDEEIPFEEILKFGEDLYEAAKTKKIPRRFLHQLLRLHYTYFKDGRPVKVLYIPVLLYQIIRNIKDDNWSVELRSKLISSTDSIKWMEKIRVPVTYALLKSRR